MVTLQLCAHILFGMAHARQSPNYVLLLIIFVLGWFSSCYSLTVTRNRGKVFITCQSDSEEFNWTSLDLNNSITIHELIVWDCPISLVGVETINLEQIDSMSLRNVHPSASDLGRLIEGAPNLVHLDISQNGLNAIPEAVSALGGLIEVNVSANDFTGAVTMKLPVSLRKIAANHMRLTELTFTEHLRSLQLLDVSYNDISSLDFLSDASFPVYMNLLDVSFNQLASVNRETVQSKRISFLHTAGNPLQCDPSLCWMLDSNLWVNDQKLHCFPPDGLSSREMSGDMCDLTGESRLGSGNNGRKSQIGLIIGKLPKTPSTITP